MLLVLPACDLSEFMKQTFKMFQFLSVAFWFLRSTYVHMSFISTDATYNLGACVAKHIEHTLFLMFFKSDLFSSAG